MIQAVAEDEERGALGMHYTSVPNILKVLNPLFQDDLRARLAEAGDSQRILCLTNGSTKCDCKDTQGDQLAIKMNLRLR